jgi:hypothetical protein
MFRLDSNHNVAETVELNHIEKSLAVDNIEYTSFADVCYICHDEGEDH